MRVPVSVGENAIETTQLLYTATLVVDPGAGGGPGGAGGPGGRLLPQVFETIWKSPEPGPETDAAIWMFERLSVAVPTFVKMTGMAALLLPTSWAGKVMLLGSRLTIGTAVAVWVIARLALGE
jgi:hypothetical protein